MELLNNTVTATFIINLLFPLLIVSFLGWGIVLMIRRKSAIYRSLMLTSVMISLLLVAVISLGSQLMNISWGDSFLSITQNQAGDLETVSSTRIADTQPLAKHMEKAAPVSVDIIEIQNVDANSNTEIALKPLLINCFGILWLGGFLFFLLKFSYSLIFLRGFKAATVTELDDKFMIILREVNEIFKFKFIPEIFISKAVVSPIAIGISRISVFIPENLYINMTEDELRSILLFHEFAHIHHKDHLFSILNQLILGINWWNPLIYHISTEQNLAREDICDNYAIQGVKSAEVYSTCLVNLAEKVCLISNLPATAGMAGKSSSLEQRIKSILKKDRKMFFTTTKSAKFATITLCVSLASFIGGMTVFSTETKSAKETLEKAPITKLKKVDKRTKASDLGIRNIYKCWKEFNKILPDDVVLSLFMLRKNLVDVTLKIKKNSEFNYEQINKTKNFSIKAFNTKSNRDGTRSLYIGLIYQDNESYDINDKKNVWLGDATVIHRKLDEIAKKADVTFSSIGALRSGGKFNKKDHIATIPIRLVVNKNKVGSFLEHLSKTTPSLFFEDFMIRPINDKPSNKKMMISGKLQFIFYDSADIDISGDNLSFIGSNIIAEGNVLIRKNGDVLLHTDDRQVDLIKTLKTLSKSNYPREFASALEPLRIKSDSMNYDISKNIMVCSGQVQFDVGATEIFCDKMIVNFEENAKNSEKNRTIKDIICLKNVVIIGKKAIAGKAIAGKAVYDLKTGKITLTENPELRRGKDGLKGEVIIFWRDSERLSIQRGKPQNDIKN